MPALSASDEVVLHPIWLLPSTDIKLWTLYHSFFLVKVGDRIEPQVVWRVPSSRPKIEDVEAGLKFFVADISTQATCGAFSSFVITVSSGTKYFAVYLRIDDTLLVAISHIPHASFSRTVFDLLSKEDSNVRQLLLTLCEYPVLVAPGLRYSIKLTHGYADLLINSLNQIEDDDLNLITLSMVTPHILISVWEALLLERKVLVVSSSVPIVTYCCEFFRKLILPLSMINTYVPCLPESLLNTVEAPFPYLVGALRSVVYSSRVDLSDTMVVDLDNRTVTSPDSWRINDLPKGYRAKLEAELVEILHSPLSKWVTRAFDHGTAFVSHNTASPHPNTILSQRCTLDNVLRCFIKATLGLLATRACDVRAFFRRSPRVFAVGHHRRKSSAKVSTGMSQWGGLTCGCMQLLNERKDIELLQFLPCWVEMDGVTLAVYEHADELPMIYLFVKHIESVSPSPAEPEGHVFEIQVKNQVTYRFAAIDPDARREWIEVIELLTRRKVSETSLDGFANGTNDSQRPESATAEDIEEMEFSHFRSRIMQTQTISYFKSRSEFDDYEGVLADVGLSSYVLTEMEATLGGAPLDSPRKNSDEQPLMINTSPKPPNRRASIQESQNKSNNEFLINTWGMYLSKEFQRKSTRSRSLGSVGVPAKSRSDSKSGPSPSGGSKVRFYRESSVPDIVQPAKTSTTKKLFGDIMRLGSSMGLMKTDNEVVPAVIDVSQALDAQKELEVKLLTSEILQRVAMVHKKIESALRDVVVQERMDRITNILKYSQHGADDEDFFSASNVISIPIIDIIKELCEKCEMVEERNPDNMLFSEELGNVKPWEALLSSYDTNESSDAFADSVRDTILDRNDAGRICVDDILAVQIRRKMLEKITEQIELFSRGNKAHMSVYPTLRAMRGYLHEQEKNIEWALGDYAAEALTDERPIMHCVSKLFGQFRDRMDVNNLMITATDLEGFLQNTSGYGHIVELEAQRLVSEMIHRYFSRRMAERVCTDDMDSNFVEDSMTSTAAIHDGKEENEVSSFRRELASGIYSRKRVSISSTQSYFAYTASNAERSDVLNEAVMCTSSNSKPCELSVQLLTSLREILKAAYDTVSGNDTIQNRLATGHLSMMMTNEHRELILRSSAYRAFEMQSCQVQKVDVPSLDDDQKAFFLLNMYNVITVHGILMRGIPSNSVYDKYIFLRNAKYNIGGHIFSLIEIEHLLLRAHSASMIPTIGLTLIALSPISERDPRYKYVPTTPRPLISFFLFQATASSPPFATLWDPHSLDTELRRAAQSYLQQTVVVNIAQKSIAIPEIVKFFSKDFGGKKVVQNLLGIVGPQLAAEIIELLKETPKPKVTYTPYDWSFKIVF